MFYAILAVHIIVSLILIAVVLLQSGKGADLAGAFGGGGSQTAFGARGAGTILSKLTTTCAVIFMITSLGLAILYNKRSSSVTEGPYTAAPQPVTTAPAPTPAQPAVPAAQTPAPPTAQQPAKK
jgi:preprotein translocase subunit SecG